MTEKDESLLFKLLKDLVKLCYPERAVLGTDNLPEESCIIVGNHTQIHGPLCAELYIPGKHATWCAGEMMHLKEVPEYAFRDFWSQKPRWTHPGYRLLSYLIAPLSVYIFNNAHTIGVYHDTRLIGTFKHTVQRLQQGNNIVIFPEHDVKYNHVVYEFQTKFVDVAKLYYRKTGKSLSFVPMYVAPALKQIHLGKPIRFDPGTPIEEERNRICQYLMDAVTDIAVSLPEHTVIPYRNIPKKYYPCNIPKEESHANPKC